MTYLAVNGNKVLDSSNYAEYCTPGNIGAAPSSHVHADSVRTYNFHVHDTNYLLGTFATGQSGYTLVIKIYTGAGYNANIEQHRTAEIIIRTSNGSSQNNGYYISGHVEQGVYGYFASFYLLQVNTGQYELYVSKWNFSGGSFYEVSCYGSVTWTHKFTAVSTIPSCMELTQFKKMYNNGGTFTGSISAPSFKATSDRNLKDNIVKMDTLPDISVLHTYSYNLKNCTDDARKVGLLAQEVAQVLPEAVTTSLDKDHHLELDYNAIVAVLVSICNDQEKRIRELEHRCICDDKS